MKIPPCQQRFVLEMSRRSSPYFSSSFLMAAEGVPAFIPCSPRAAPTLSAMDDDGRMIVKKGFCFSLYLRERQALLGYNVL